MALQSFFYVPPFSGNGRLSDGEVHKRSQVLTYLPCSCRGIAPLAPSPFSAFIDSGGNLGISPPPVTWPLHSKFFLPYQCQISFFSVLDFGLRKSSMSHVPRRRLGQRPQPASARASVPGRGQSAGISRRLSGSKRRSLTERRIFNGGRAGEHTGVHV